MFQKLIQIQKQTNKNYKELIFEYFDVQCVENKEEMKKLLFKYFIVQIMIIMLCTEKKTTHKQSN